LDEQAHAVPRRTRALVYAFLGVFAITGLAHLEAWPFTGFRLFSELRTSERETWVVVAVDRRGDETHVDLSDLPVGSRGSAKLIDGFDDLSRSERDAVCHAWVEPRQERGEDVAEVRVYARVDSVRPDGPPATRTLAYTCGRGP
jgi:hypothetical protein